MENYLILLALIILVIFFISKLDVFVSQDKKRENFNITINSNSDKNKEISEYWQKEGYKLLKVPNFFEVFGLDNLSKILEINTDNNWKLFTDTDLVKNKGLGAILSGNKLEDINFYDVKEENVRTTGFKKPTAVIGIMSPTKITPSGQWLKSFTWIGSSKYRDNTNAKKVIVWANHSNNTYIKLDKNGFLEDAIKLFEFEVGQTETLLTSKEYHIDNYKSNNHPPFTTYYFQIMNNWGNPDSVEVGGLILNYEI